MTKNTLLINLFLTGLIAIDYWLYPDLFCSFLSIIGLMGIVWIISLIVKDASIVDIFWGPCFIIYGLSVNHSIGETTERALLVLGLVSLWALRIALHIGIRILGMVKIYDMLLGGKKLENTGGGLAFSESFTCKDV